MRKTAAENTNFRLKAEAFAEKRTPNFTRT